MNLIVANKRNHTMWKRKKICAKRYQKFCAPFLRSVVSLERCGNYSFLFHGEDRTIFILYTWFLNQFWHHLHQSFFLEISNRHNSIISNFASLSIARFFSLFQSEHLFTLNRRGHGGYYDCDFKAVHERLSSLLNFNFSHQQFYQLKLKLLF